MSGDDQERERLDMLVPKETKERLRQSDSSMTDTVLEALEIYFGEEQTGNRSAIERQIQRYQEQKARGQQMIQNGEDMVQEAEEGISRLRSRLDQLEERQGDYDETLETQLEEMREEGISLFPGHVTLQRIAQEFDKDQGQVIQDLKKRSDLNDTYFTEGPPENADQLGLNVLSGDSE